MISNIAKTLFRSARGLVPSKVHDLLYDIYKRFLGILPIKTLIRVQYFKSFQTFPNFKEPKTFNEKCQWLKLSGDPRLPICTDKVTVKTYVAQRIGRNRVIPTLFCGDKLPPPKERNWPIPFVIKASHGSGFNIFIRSPKDIDWPKIESKLDEWLSYKFGALAGELYYTFIKPKVLVEPFISKTNDLPPVYKVFTFNGVPKYIGFNTGTYENDPKRVFYDTSWARQDFRLGYPIEPREIPKPECLEQMLEAASKLGQGFGFVSSDFYVIDGHLYFSEMEFTPEAGFTKFYPNEMDRVFGDMWPI